MSELEQPVSEKKSENPEPEMNVDEVRVALSELLPEDRLMGPAMKALSERQRMFVIACLDLGAWKNHARGARLAGYTGKHEGQMKLQGWRLAHNPKVQAALLEESKKRIQAGTVGAANFVLELVADEQADKRLRLKASEMVLDRGGVHAVTEHRVPETTPEDRAEKLLRVAALAKSLGLDPRVVLGNLADGLPGDLKTLEPRLIGSSDAAADAERSLVGVDPAAQPAATTREETA